jgi:hypothetical protein
MLIQRINRTDPEKIFIVVKNSYSTAAITVGQAVVWDYTTDADGVGVIQPTTALLKAECGVVESASIAVDGYGLVQVYGHHASAQVDGSTGTTGGKPLTVQDGSFALIAATGTSGVSHSFIAGETYSTGAAAAKKVFIRCL